MVGNDVGEAGMTDRYKLMREKYHIVHDLVMDKLMLKKIQARDSSGMKKGYVRGWDMTVLQEL